MLSIHCKGNLISLETPKIMGILNLTPDSFFDGGQIDSIQAALSQCDKMINDGADFIDIGAYSSRPGAAEVTFEEERKRLIPVLEALVNKFPAILFSIDTFRASIAKEALDVGAALINDISAGSLDDKMIDVIQTYNVPYIAMHMQGIPKTMQKKPTYKDILGDLMHFFSTKIAELKNKGISDIIIDPGFGFGKTLEQNYSLLRQFDLFQEFGVPVLAGVSRKSMIYKLLEKTPQEALNGTTVLHTVALMKKAQFLRVHDVKEAKECVQLIQQLQ